MYTFLLRRHSRRNWATTSLVGLLAVAGLSTNVQAQTLPFGLSLLQNPLPISENCYFDPANRVYIYKGIDCLTGKPLVSSDDEQREPEQKSPTPKTPVQNQEPETGGTISESDG